MSALFVVSSINLLSRPERGREGNAAVKGVAESNCYIVQTKRKFFQKHLIHMQSQRLFRQS